MVAYPATRYHGTGTPAEDFLRALVAHFQRIARNCGEFDSLPLNAKTLRKSQMLARLQTGEAKFVRSLLVLDLLNAAFIGTLSSKDALEERHQWLSIEHGKNLGSVNFTMALSGAIEPNEDRPTLRSLILKYRSDFGSYTGDDDIVYQNIFNRAVLPVLRLLPIAMYVRNALFERVAEADARELALTDVLVRQCDWAADIEAKLSKFLFLSQTIMHAIGREACECRFLKVVQRD